MDGDIEEGDQYATSHKIAGIMNMFEQMVEPRKWKAIRGIGDTDGKCAMYVDNTMKLFNTFLQDVNDWPELNTSGYIIMH